MEIGMIGLGNMGASMTRRLLAHGHQVVAHDLREDAVAEVAREGAHGVRTLPALVEELRPPRVVWLMVPAGEPAAEVIEELGGLLDGGDLVVDGANSRFTDTTVRARALAEREIRFADVGVSGGVWGLEEGYCLMVGAEEEDFPGLEPALAALAPEGGYARVGPPGAGHFAKMVHNGIEYGVLQAYGEGFELLEAAEEYRFDLGRIAELWRHGAVIRSWLLDLLAGVLRGDARLQGVRGWVEDSGTGRWTVEEAVARAVPVPVIAASLFARFRSRQEDSMAARVIAALRREFGGHAVRSGAPDRGAT